MAGRFRNWVRKTFRSSPKPQPQTLAPGIEIAPLPSLEQTPLLNSKDIHHMFMAVSQNYVIDPKLSKLVDDSLEYDSLFQHNTIPSKDDSDFVKKTAEMNQKMMAANEKMLVSFMNASEDYFKKWSDEKNKKNGDPELAKRYEDMGICLKKMAENMQGQKMKLTNLYDQTMETYRSNPEAMSQVQGKSYADLYAVQRPFQMAENAGKKLGQGAMNTVYKVEVDGKDRVFKEGHVHFRDLDSAEAGFFIENVGVQKTTFQYGGKSMQIMKDVNTANRDVAMSRVDKLLGLGIVVDTKLVRAENGELSSLMDFSGGFSVQSYDYAINNAEIDMVKAYQMAEYPRWIENRQRTVDRIKNSMASDPENAENYQKSLNEVESVLRDYRSRQNNVVISVRDQSLNKGLMDMAALDYICSHTDRHLNNYMIEETNGQFRIHAIDNDIAFKNRDIDTPGTFNAPVVELETNFPFVAAELKEKIDAISTDMLRNSLEGLLNQEQIDISCQRLEAIQEHFRKIPVVEGDFTEAQLDQLLDPKNTRTCYNAKLSNYARELSDSTEFRDWKEKVNAQKQDSAKPVTQTMNYKTFEKEAIQANEHRKGRLHSGAKPRDTHNKSKESMIQKSGPAKK